LTATTAFAPATTEGKNQVPRPDRHPEPARKDEPMQTPSPEGSDPLGGSASGDPLAEIDQLIQNKRGEEQKAADRSAQLQTDRSDFAAEFTSVCEEQVRPAMEAILQRLRRNGGGGVIDERPENVGQHHTHRLTLWMSFSGEITGAPRQDRHPYLQLDADIDKRSVAVSEGDMWQGQGGNRSGKFADWQLVEITAPRVTQEILAIIRRALR
jgi:hypothetical protein